MNWISAARVFGDADIAIIHQMVLIHHDILKYCAEAQRLEDIRFLLRREINGFGITASFDVEDPIVAPAMLIVANKMAFGICGERGFAGTAQTEEKR